MVDQITSLLRQTKEEREKGEGRRVGLFGLLRAQFAGWLIGPVVILVFFPTALLLFFCMLPTLVAFICDTQREKYATRTVGYLNLSASFALGWNLWTNDNSVPGAIALVSDSLWMVIVYSFALLGWGIYWLIPKVVLTYLNVALEMRLRHAKVQRIKLVRNWGAEVGEDAEALLVMSDAPEESVVQPKKKSLIDRMRFWERIVDRAREETDQVIEQHRRDNANRIKTLQQVSQIGTVQQDSAVVGDDALSVDATKEIDETQRAPELHASDDDRIRQAQLDASD